MSLILKGISNIITNLDQTGLQSVVSAIQADINSLFEMAHKPSLKLRIQSLSLIFSLVKVEEDLKDRFYRALYELILTLREVSVSKLDDFFRLIYKAMRADTNPQRVQAFIKRLL
jgi:ribosome biogenesis protein MAK21